MASVKAGPTTITAKLTYMKQPPAGVRAFQTVNVDPATGDRNRNYTREEREVELENLRGKEDSVSLDLTGFQYYHEPSRYTTFASDEEIEREYYPESIELFKKLTGASRVEIFDHTIRRRRPNELDTDASKRQPVAQTHVDQTTASAIARVHRHLPAEDVPALLQKRFQIVNLWRPIFHTAIDWPLALCDYRSVEPEKDTFPIALIYPDREGETLGVNYSPNHRWKYMYGMTPEEIVLIKCFDSVQDGSVAIFTPHTGFDDPTTPAGTPLRESIELRALVFYD